MDYSSQLEFQSQSLQASEFSSSQTSLASGFTSISDYNSVRSDDQSDYSFLKSVKICML